MFILAVLTTSLQASEYRKCLDKAIDISEAVAIAKEYVGKPYKVWISSSKRTGECFWKARGTKGYVSIEASSGEVVRFRKYRR